MSKIKVNIKNIFFYSFFSEHLLNNFYDETLFLSLVSFFYIEVAKNYFV